MKPTSRVRNAITRPTARPEIVTHRRGIGVSSARASARPKAEASYSAVVAAAVDTAEDRPHPLLDELRGQHQPRRAQMLAAEIVQGLCASGLEGLPQAQGRQLEVSTEALRVLVVDEVVLGPDAGRPQQGVVGEAFERGNQEHD